MKPEHELELQIIEEKPKDDCQKKADEMAIRTKILEEKMDKIIKRLKK